MQNLVALGFMAMYREISKVFPLSPRKTSDPWGVAKFDHRAIIWALLQILVSLGLMPRYWEISKAFPIYAQEKICEPQGGDKFDPRNIIWALLVEAY